MPRVLGGSYGVGRFLMCEVPLCNPGRIRSREACTVSTVARVTLPSITEKDKADLIYGVQQVCHTISYLHVIYIYIYAIYVIYVYVIYIYYM